MTSHLREKFGCGPERERFDQLMSWPVHELRNAIAHSGGSSAGLLEKDELVEVAMGVMAFPSPPPKKRKAEADPITRVDAKERKTTQ